MDIVDLDRVLDEFEEDEERSLSTFVSGCDVRQIGIGSYNSQPYPSLNRSDSLQYSQEVDDEISPIEIQPTQHYDTPYELSEKIDMSEADFAPMPTKSMFSFDITHRYNANPFALKESYANFHMVPATPKTLEQAVEDSVLYEDTNNFKTKQIEISKLDIKTNHRTQPDGLEIDANHVPENEYIRDSNVTHDNSTTDPVSVIADNVSAINSTGVLPNHDISYIAKKSGLSNNIIDSQYPSASLPVVGLVQKREEENMSTDRNEKDESMFHTGLALSQELASALTHVNAGVVGFTNVGMNDNDEIDEAAMDEYLSASPPHYSKQQGINSSAELADNGIANKQQNHDTNSSDIYKVNDAHWSDIVQDNTQVHMPHRDRAQDVMAYYSQDVNTQPIISTATDASFSAIGDAQGVRFADITSSNSPLNMDDLSNTSTPNTGFNREDNSETDTNQVIMPKNRMQGSYDTAIPENQSVTSDSAVADSIGCSERPTGTISISVNDQINSVSAGCINKSSDSGSLLSMSSFVPILADTDTSHTTSHTEDHQLLMNSASVGPVTKMQAHPSIGGSALHSARFNNVVNFPNHTAAHRPEAIGEAADTAKPAGFVNNLSTKNNLNASSEQGITNMINGVNVASELANNVQSSSAVLKENPNLNITQQNKSLTRLPHSQSDILIEQNNLSENSLSPSTLSGGVKVKEVNRMKRPNSLLGLSTVSLSTPTSDAAPPASVMNKSQSLDLLHNAPVASGDLGTAHVKVSGVEHSTVKPLIVDDLLGGVNFDEDMASASSVIETNGGTHSIEPHLPEDSTSVDLLNDVQPMQCDNGESITSTTHLALIPESVSSAQDPCPYPSWDSEQTSPPSSGDFPSGNSRGGKRPTSLNLQLRQEFNEHGAMMADIEYIEEGEGVVDNISGELEGHTQPMEEAQDAGAVEADSMEEQGAVGGDDLNSLHHHEPMDLIPAAGTGNLPTVQTDLGQVAPYWIPDNEAPYCMECDSRFTFTKRRHHCRACGKIYCSTCCNQKCRLQYMDSKEARVCKACHHILSIIQSAGGCGTLSQSSPDPCNPSDYCSIVPPQDQVNMNAPAPTVMVPVTGVLRKEGSQRRGEPKQVIFSDGIRPGGDLTEIDAGPETRLPHRSSGRKVKKVDRTSTSSAGETPPGGSPRSKAVHENHSSRFSCLVPEMGLPPLLLPSDTNVDSFDSTPDAAVALEQIQNEEAAPVTFMVNRNLLVQVKMVNLDCCVSRRCWCFSSKGMCTVGQEEIVIILECLDDEATLPTEIFLHMQQIYTDAGKGNTLSEMCHSLVSGSFLGNREHGGFLFFHATFQCLQRLPLPSSPFLFGVLLQKWEVPWAKVFPIRLLLRLGAEFRYYPCPLVSVRNRKPVFCEIGHTIMNLLADFRNFQYMLTTIRGMVIHMEDKKTVINMPRNRYDELMKLVGSSNEHVMAMGANFSMEADSHLVCIQNEDGNYQTQAINIQNKTRKVTGASFVVFNGALKTSSGLMAKSSIVEDGLMVQITPECMIALKQSLKEMKDHVIGCGSLTAPKPEEEVTFHWIDDDKSVNVGVTSPLDGMSMSGVESIHIHNGTDYMGENHVIRWTEVFFIQNEDSSSRWEPVDLSRLAETLARAFCIALTPYLDQLKAASLTKIGLRATIDSETVGYEAGSRGERLPDLYMNELDNELIPVIHNAASQNQEGPIVMELIFYVLN